MKVIIRIVIITFCSILISAAYSNETDNSASGSALSEIESLDTSQKDSDSEEEKKKTATVRKKRRISKKKSTSTDKQLSNEELETMAENISQLSTDELVILNKYMKQRSMLISRDAKEIKSSKSASMSGVAVELTSYAENKISVIKVVRSVTGMGLKDTKDLVESVPVVIVEDIDVDEATRIKGLLEEAGASVNIIEQGGLK